MGGPCPGNHPPGTRETHRRKTGLLVIDGCHDELGTVYVLNCSSEELRDHGVFLMGYEADDMLSDNVENMYTFLKCLSSATLRKFRADAVVPGLYHSNHDGTKILRRLSLQTLR